MKMDIRFVMLSLLTCALLSACGKQRTASSAFINTKASCEDEAAPKRFNVQFFDGHTEMITAESQEEFINGYLTRNLDKIDFAEHDFVVRNHSGEVTPATGFANNWGAVRMDASSLWQVGVRGAGVTVAVIDSGMDLTHVQLRDQVAINNAEVDGNGIDDDGNGLIDDYKGFDFADNRALQGDSQHHGTHVAGIIAAAHNDTVAGAQGYVQGIAPSAKILPLLFLKGEEGYISDAVRAIYYAVGRGARIINASWGGSDCSRLLKTALTNLHGQGVMFIGSAGNESYNIDRQPMFPGSLNLASQFTIGSITSRDVMSHFSNYGEISVHIFAPGSDIISTYPGDRMASLSGTSMSAPMVSGAVALLASAEPTATMDQIRSAIENTALRRSQFINASHGRVLLTNTLTELRRLLSLPTAP